MNTAQAPAPGAPVPRVRGRAGAVALSLYRGWRRAGAKGFTVCVRGAFAALGPNTVIEPPVRLAGERRIEIGAGVFVGAGSWLRAAPGTGVALRIGDGTSIAGQCVLSAERAVVIGKRVLMARNVYIADHRHAYEDPRSAVLDQGVTGVAPVEVGDGAWLGQNVVICPGVRIGRGAVVGANAVVRDDVPDHALAVGAPARVVRSFGHPSAVAG